MALAVLLCASHASAATVHGRQAVKSAQPVKKQLKSQLKSQPKSQVKTNGPVRRLAERMVPDGHREEGLGGWYGRFHHGRKTASGEPFATGELTAAHPYLPFNSLLKVTNPSSGESVIVRVTDRGPFVAGRIIDVSEQAARQIGLWSRGVARVVVEKLGKSAAPLEVPAALEPDLPAPLVAGD